MLLPWYYWEFAGQYGFGVAHGELGTATTREIPEVVAFNSHCTIIIECKTSRSDFLIDKKGVAPTGAGYWTLSGPFCSCVSVFQ